MTNLLAEGRPVYVSTLLQQPLPAMATIISGLERRFRLEPDGESLFRVYPLP